jgi:hypothetical protein
MPENRKNQSVDPRKKSDIPVGGKPGKQRDVADDSGAGAPVTSDGGPDREIDPDDEITQRNVRIVRDDDDDEPELD